MKEQQQTWKKELGIMDVAINVVNITIGGGIFLLPALIAPRSVSSQTETIMKTPTRSNKK